MSNGLDITAVSYGALWIADGLRDASGTLEDNDGTRPGPGALSTAPGTNARTFTS